MSVPARTSSYEDVLASRKMRWWYESLADYMIANPQATQVEIATHFCRAPSTISIVINTDAFRAYYRGRRAAHEASLSEEVRGKLFKVANTSLDMMLETLTKKRDSVPLEMLHRTADTALKSLGYGAPAPTGTSVTVNPTVNVAVSVEDLEAARLALRRNQERVIEHEPGAFRAEGAARQIEPEPAAPAAAGSGQPDPITDLA